MEGMGLVSTSALQVLMLAVFFFALFLEIKTGGMGAGVLLGLVAAGIFWGSQYARGLIDLYQVGLFLGGILCILVELLLPTVGLLAGLGVAMLLYSVLLALGGDMSAVTAMAIALLVSVVAFILIAKRLPTSRLWAKVVLKDESTSAKGYVSAAEDTTLLGKRGRVRTELRPSGTADIDGKLVDVVSEGAFLPVGTEVVVREVHGSRVVVRQSEQVNSKQAESEG